VVRRALRGGSFAYRGEHFAFDEVQITPRPTPVPLVLGGNSARALRRAATLGDGWFSSGTPSLPEAIRLRDDLNRLREEAGRAEDPFRCYVRVEGCDPEVVDRYAAAGFEDIAFWADQLWRGEGLDERRRGLGEAATALGLARAPDASL
jgi:alkanesulfonate monooxygenase SsuD/methylene tetrahydromethanopterin reductase-like flavin-dependent oxidoreductase (luciferase family)